MIGERKSMAKYKVVTQKPAGVTFDLADSQYLLEKESLDSIDAEIIAVDAATEDEFIASAKDADAVNSSSVAASTPIISASFESSDSFSS
jgi:hypothetical protein